MRHRGLRLHVVFPVEWATILQPKAHYRPFSAMPSTGARASVLCVPPTSTIFPSPFWIWRHLWPFPWSFGASVPNWEYSLLAFIPSLQFYHQICNFQLNYDSITRDWFKRLLVNRDKMDPNCASRMPMADQLVIKSLFKDSVVTQYSLRQWSDHDDHCSDQTSFTLVDVTKCMVYCGFAQWFVLHSYPLCPRTLLYTLSGNVCRSTD